jgi:hypothetical protein
METARKLSLNYGDIIRWLLRYDAWSDQIYYTIQRDPVQQNLMIWKRKELRFKTLSSFVFHATAGGCAKAQRHSLGRRTANFAPLLTAR